MACTSFAGPMFDRELRKLRNLSVLASLPSRTPRRKIQAEQPEPLRKGADSSWFLLTWSSVIDWHGGPGKTRIWNALPAVRPASQRIRVFLAVQCVQASGLGCLFM